MWQNSIIWLRARRSAGAEINFFRAANAADSLSRYSTSSLSPLSGWPHLWCCLSMNGCRQRVATVRATSPWNSNVSNYQMCCKYNALVLPYIHFFGTWLNKCAIPSIYTLLHTNRNEKLWTDTANALHAVRTSQHAPCSFLVRRNYTKQ